MTFWRSLWKTYYASIFNPARLKPKAMRAEMPQRHWATLPETQLITELMASAGPGGGDDESECIQVPEHGNGGGFFAGAKFVPHLRAAAQTCRGCGIYCNATQAVFGEGPAACDGDVYRGAAGGSGGSWRGSRSWGRRGSCWTRRWRRRAFDAGRGLCDERGEAF